MPTDLYKIQNALERPRKSKKPKKVVGSFSIQKKRLEESDYLIRNKRKKKDDKHN